jgi:hypothetical protein
MTETAFPFDDPADEQEFNDALNALLQFAYERDLDIQGSWDCRNRSSHPDWDVAITEVQKPPTSNRKE